MLWLKEILKIITASKKSKLNNVVVTAVYLQHVWYRSLQVIIYCLKSSHVIQTLPAEAAATVTCCDWRLLTLRLLYVSANPRVKRCWTHAPHHRRAEMEQQDDLRTPINNITLRAF